MQNYNYLVQTSTQDNFKLSEGEAMNYIVKLVLSIFGSSNE